jgi:hypothetical protein
MQGAGIDKCSSLHTSMVLQECIEYNRSKNETVYVAFLDSQKAFDTVWIEGLMYKLYNTGINLKSWRIIRQLYTKFQCAAYVAGVAGSWFTPARGVHQGAPMSMILYLIYINDMLIQLRSSPYGAKIGSINTSCPAFADDVSLVAINKLCLNNLLQIAAAYSKLWRFSFNATKSVCMIWGKDTSPNMNVMLGRDKLQVV